MTILKTNTLEGGTDGVDISNANSGGVSFDNLTNITKTDATATLKYSAAGAIVGALGMRAVTGVIAAQVYDELAFSAQTEIAASVYFRLSTIGTGVRILRIWGTGGQASGLIGTVQVNASGIVRFLDSGGATKGTMTVPIVAGTPYRLGVHVKPGTAGGSDTQVELTLWTAPTFSGLPFDSCSTTVAVSLGTDVTNVRMGITSQAVAALTVDIDHPQIADGSVIPPGLQVFSASASIGAVGAVTAQAVGAVGGSASIGATGAVATTGRGESFGQGTAPGAGGLTATGSIASTVGQDRAFETHIVYEDSTIWGGTGSGAVVVDGAAAIGATGGVAAAGTATKFGQASLGGTGAGASAGTATRFAQAAPAAAGDLGGTGRGETTGQASLHAQGSLDAAATPSQIGSAIVGGAGSLAATASPVEAFAEAHLTGSADAAATPGLRVAFAAGAIGGAAGLIFGEGIIGGPPDPPQGTEPGWEERPPAWDVLPPLESRYPAPPIREVAFDELDAAGRVAYMRALRYSRHAKTRVLILDPSESPIVDLAAEDSLIYDGSVQIDSTQAVARRLTLSIADPTRSLVELDALSAADAPIAPGGFVHVERIDEVPELGQFVSVPIFRGSIASFERAGPDVTLEGLSKESRLMIPSAVWQSMTIGKGTPIVEAIRRLAAAMGETRFRLPEVALRLQAPLSVARGQGAWGLIKALARTLGRDVFYDAAGYLTARTTPVVPAWAFIDDGEESNVLSEGADVIYDMTAVRNAVLVVGKAPSKGARPSGLAVAPPEHPLSPQALARGSKPSYLFERVEADQLTRSADCKARADAQLAAFLIAGVSASFDAMMNPLIEVGDVASLDAGGLQTTFRLTSATIPLAGGLMSIGDVRRIPARRKARRRVGVGR